MEDPWVAFVSHASRGETFNSELLAWIEAFPDALIKLCPAGTLLAYRPPTEPRAVSSDAWPGAPRPRGLSDLAQALGQVLEQWLPAACAGEWRARLKEALSSGQTQTYLCELDLPGGHCSFDVRMVPRGQQDVVVFLRDVSAEREREQRERAALLEERRRLLSSIDEKDTLLREVHHRVKNHLQVMASLLNIQLNRTGEREARALLADAGNRVRSIAMLHDSACPDPTPARVDMQEYVSKLVRNLTRTYVEVAHRVRVSEELDRVVLPVDLALPCGLIVNELLTNAFKHAFPLERCSEGRVRIALSGREAIELWVEDDGVGVLDEAAWKRANSVGMSLIRALSRQLDAKVEMQSSPRGTSFNLLFDGSRARLAHSVPPLSA